MRSFLLFICLVISTNCWSRGGGGCLEQGTLISTPAGDVSIEKLKKGDVVYSRAGNTEQTATVVATTQVDPQNYIDIQLPTQSLHVTKEHLIATAQGVFRRAGSLTTQDKVLAWQNHHWQQENIVALKTITSHKPAYNLLVDNGASYVANTTLVHNKGCFLPETPIMRADGSTIAISKVKPGDKVKAYEADGKFMSTTVRAVLRHEVNQYYMVVTDHIELNVTGEHPFYVGNGTFKTIETLHVGDVVYAYADNQLRAQHIKSMTLVHAKTIVYNLQTDEPHTYFASGIAVHNKGGGCFPAGTQINIPGGVESIELLAPGDHIISVNRNGSEFIGKINSTYATRSRIYILTTNKGRLRTTAEHPIATSAGTFKRADALSIHDTILYYQNSSFTNAVIQDIQITPEALVFNLETSSPHTFIADHVLVHNKGGFGGSRLGGISNRPWTLSDWLVFGIVVFIWIFLPQILSAPFRNRKSEDLDYINSRPNIQRKAAKTVKLLDFLAKQDDRMLPQALKDRTREVFVKLQQCWQSRDYAPMKDLMMPDLYNQHVQQINGLIRNHEINKIVDLRIESIDIVNVRYTDKENQREFTALITACAEDYYIDDRNNKYLRGNTTSSRFQEFWTFELEPTGWLLRDIEQSRESDYLKEENFVEMFTDLQIKKIYGDEVDNLGASGPWLPKAVADKESKVDRMLNFLVSSNKMWDRQTMVLRARSIFTQVHMSFEAGQLNPDVEANLYPDIAIEMKATLNTWKTNGNTIEYRNFCIRKIEIVLVNSYDDKSRDSFIARISAHAQVIHLKNGKVISQDSDVSPFVEFWEFGNLDNQWKLKDAKPASDADIINAENIEESTSPNLVKWYYTKKRAI